MILKELKWDRSTF